MRPQAVHDGRASSDLASSGPPKVLHQRVWYRRSSQVFPERDAPRRDAVVVLIEVAEEAVHLVPNKASVVFYSSVASRRPREVCSAPR